MENGIAIDVAAILRDYGGFDVAHVPKLSSGGRPLLGLLVPEHNLVAVEANSIEGRKRFSMAHELGHAELEHDFGATPGLFSAAQRPCFACTSADERTSDNDERMAGARRRREIRANQFAATLLMPDDLVREVWRERRDVERVASLLVVSSEALGYRLRELRVI
jgi:Zn-dependent peptidase ImmA (M78 family)